MNIMIEKAVAADAEALLEYLRQVGAETDNLTFGAEGMPITVEEEAAYLDVLADSKDNVMLVAKEGNRIIGNAALNRQPRRMRHRGNFAISVRKECWNRGIGRKLLETVIAFARENDFEIIDLQVRSDNLAAIHLYEKYGFERLYTYPAFFKMNGEEIDFEIMCLRL
ncbi:MAG: GNAT family N-acetyltransferase [Schaedlerella sp.]|nr:GNAT family N-acetyltransferase [Schaedlerella sp.]